MIILIFWPKKAIKNLKRKAEEKLNPILA